VDYLVAGIALGLGAGLAPGPLLALVVSTSLSRGFAAGARAALSPLASDVPVVVITVLVLHSLPQSAVAVLGMAGGVFVMWLGVESLREVPTGADGARDSGDPLRRGALLNLLSPHPWIFWITVGGPLLVAAWSAGAAPALGFLVGFYVLLIGSKVLVAGLVAGGSRRLTPRALHRAHRLSGVVLLLVGALLTAEFARTLLP
jgi:threonine/homoserine/homoserine lactone efflux protein